MKNVLLNYSKCGAMLCALALCAPFVQAQCVAPPSGLVAWWKAEGNAVDSVGGNNGTLHHGASATAVGTVGQTFSFDGVDDKLTVPDSASLKLTSSLTLEAWVYVTAFPTASKNDAGWGKILFRGDDRAGVDPYFLAVHSNGKAYFHIEQGIQGQNLAAPIATGRFVHIAGTLNGDSGLMRLYLDGSPVAEVVTSLRPQGDLDPTRHPGVSIGNSPNASTFKFPFNGQIDEVSIYSRALSATEIKNIYDAGSAGKCTETIPSLAVSNPRAFLEGSAGAPGSTTFGIRLSAPSAGTVTVNYQTANGLVNGAVAGQDYVAQSGTVTFNPGQTLKTVTVPFIGEAIAELNETFFLNLGIPTNATRFNTRGKAFIGNDDGSSLFIDNARSVTEGNSGTTPQQFVVRLSAASTNTITVDWATGNGPATGGAGPADFTVANGTLSFAPGETTKTITIQVKGDTIVEPNEKYFVNLTRPTFAIIADSQGSGFILNDDASGVMAPDAPSQ